MWIIKLVYSVGLLQGQGKAWGGSKVTKIASGVELWECPWAYLETSGRTFTCEAGGLPISYRLFCCEALCRVRLFIYLAQCGQPWLTLQCFKHRSFPTLLEMLQDFNLATSVWEAGPLMTQSSPRRHQAPFRRVTLSSEVNQKQLPWGRRVITRVNGRSRHQDCPKQTAVP